MSIVAAGSFALDDIETVNGSVTGIPGGSALYFCVAASLFTPVSVVSIIGDDFPDSEIQFLKNRQVNIDNLTIIKNDKTFRWGTKYDTDMNRRFTTRRELNVSGDFNPVLVVRAGKIPGSRSGDVIDGAEAHDDRILDVVGRCAIACQSGHVLQRSDDEVENVQRV